MKKERFIRTRTIRPASWLILVLVLMLALLLTACGKKTPQNPGTDVTGQTAQTGGTQPEPTRDDPTKERIKAYDFTLTDQRGEKHKLSDYEGKVIFLNFWATWCKN